MLSEQGGLANAKCHSLAEGWEVRPPIRGQASLRP